MCALACGLCTCASCRRGPISLCAGTPLVCCNRIHLHAAADEDTEATTADEEQAAGEAAAMDVDPSGEQGEAAAGQPGQVAPADASAPQQEQQEQQPAAAAEQQQPADVQPAAAAAQQDGGEATAADAAAAAAVEVPVSVPAFLMAQAAVVGADAEEEDYDA